MRFDLKKTRKPQVDHLSFVHPAQFASEKALISVDADFWIFNPTPDVCCRYRGILLTVVQCRSVGDCKDWHTLLTEYDISGRVSVKYCKAPSILVYFVVSTVESIFPFVLTTFLMSILRRQQVYTFPSQLEIVILKHSLSVTNTHWTYTGSSDVNT